MKRVFSILFIFVFIFTTASAQNKSTGNYFYQRGLEAIQNEDIYTAINYFHQAFNADSNNMPAKFWYAAILADSIPAESFYLLCDVIDRLPKKEKKMLSLAHQCRGKILLDADMPYLAIFDFKTSISLSKNETQSYLLLAETYTKLDDLDNSNNVLLQLLKKDKENPTAKILLAINKLIQNQESQAIQLCNEVIKSYNEYSKAYAVRAIANAKVKNYHQAASDLVSALALPDNDWAFNKISLFTDELSEALQLALHKKMTEEPTELRWYYYYAINAEANYQYSKAITNYLKINKIENSNIVSLPIARCYELMGNYREVIRYCNLVAAEDPDNSSNLLYRSIAYDELYMADSALLDMNHRVSLNPENFEPYYLRGYFQLLAHNYEDAIRDFTAAIERDSTFSYAYFQRARCYTFLNQPETARPDFVLALKYERKSENMCISPLAYYFLGNRNEARKLQEQMLQDPNLRKGEIYLNAAFLYSLLGDTDKSLQFIQSAIDVDFVRWKILRTEPMLENTRQRPEFEEMVK